MTTHRSKGMLDRERIEASIEVGGHEDPGEMKLFRRPGLIVRAWTAMEGLLERAVGRDANVFAWSGPMAVACFLLIAISGLYLFLFYQVGSSAGYMSVVAIDQTLIGRGMRALHRYASRGFMIFSLVHLVRYLVTGRFRGARWLPWVTGLLMVGLAWFVGLTGYLLVWDTRAFLASEALAGWLDSIGIFGQPISFSLLSPDSLKENVFLILLYLHITLPLLGLILGWLHVTRLARPRLLPRWALVAVLSVVYVAISMATPLETLPQADPYRAPAAFSVDLVYLAYLLLPRSLPQLWAVGAFLAVAIALAMPWIGRERVAVRVDTDRCTGCGFCAADCPFGAIRMEAPGTGQRPLARILESRCTDCAICVGACPTAGIDMGSDITTLSAQVGWTARSAMAKGAWRVVVYCSGGRVVLQEGEVPLGLPCVAAMPVWVARQFAKRGIAVRIEPCGQDACYGREGADILTARVLRRRYPFWPRKLAAEMPSRLLARPGATSVLAGSLLSLLVLAFSLWQGPYWQGSTAVLKVAIRAEAPFVWSRVLSDSEKEKLLPHMRIDQPVAGQRADLRMVLVVGGYREEKVLSPMGLHRDGPTYAYLELPLDPGEYDAEFALWPLGGDQQPMAHWQGPLNVAEGQVRIISYGVLGPELVLR